VELHVQLGDSAQQFLKLKEPELFPGILSWGIEIFNWKGMPKMICNEKF
jgi:hypothetical protein